MKMLKKMMLCLLISFSLIEIPIIQNAHAGMISTRDAVQEVARSSEQEKVVLQFLDREDVKKQLITLGVTPEEAQLRLAGLSDSEIQKIAGEIERSTAGGVIVTALTIVLLVLMIIYFAKRV